MAPKLSAQTISASLLKVCMHRQRYGTECGVQYGRLLSCSLDVGVPISSHRVDTRLAIYVRLVHTVQLLYVSRFISRTAVCAMSMLMSRSCTIRCTVRSRVLGYAMFLQ